MATKEREDMQIQPNTLYRVIGQGATTIGVIIYSGTLIVHHASQEVVPYPSAIASMPTNSGTGDTLTVGNNFIQLEIGQFVAFSGNGVGFTQSIALEEMGSLT